MRRRPKDRPDDARPGRVAPGASRGTPVGRGDGGAGGATGGAGKTTDWSGVADWYDNLVGDAGSDYHRHVVLPGTLRLLGVSGGATAGRRMLDVACGQGVLCRLLAAAGVEVVGVDAAADLIDAARRRGRSDAADGSPGTIDYRVGDARDLSSLPADHFDAAACVLAIQNVHPARPVFESAARCLVGGGQLVVVMMHPCFRGPKETAWGWDAAAATQYRRVDRYLLPRKAPIVARPGAEPGTYTWSFHRPIEHYVKALRQAGLLVDAMEEWPGHKVSTSGPRAAAENTARKEIPMFLALRAVKVAGLAPVSPADDPPTDVAD